jgi:hypothetical protein
MYWGANPASAPVASPTYTTNVDGPDIIVTITNFIAGTGEDGWSAITGYRVTCGDSAPVSSAQSPVTITGLQADTDYTCSVVAENAKGNSPASQFTTTTETTAGGLPIWLLYEATKNNI